MLFEHRFRVAPASLRHGPFPACVEQAGREFVGVVAAVLGRIFDGRFASALADQVGELVLEDACQLGPLRGVARKRNARIERGEQGFLHRILGQGVIPHMLHGIAKQIVSMCFEALGWIGQNGC